MANLSIAEPVPPAGNGGVRQILSMPAFASQIDGYLLPDHEALNRELIDEIAAWRAQDEGMVSSNRLGWHSSRTLFDRREPGMRRLQQHIGSALTTSIRRYWKEFDLAAHQVTCDGWVNVNGQGAFNAPHNHGTYHLSGCYYVTAPNPGTADSGAIEFFNPAGALTQGSFFTRKMVTTELRIQPKAGQLLIFPAYLLHWVYPNQDGGERVSIAFNVEVKTPPEHMENR